MHTPKWVFPKNGVVSRNDHCFIFRNRSSPPSFVQNYDFKVGLLDNGFLGNGQLSDGRFGLVEGMSRR